MKKYIMTFYSLIFLASTAVFTSCSTEEVVAPDNVKQENQALKHKAKTYEAELNMLNDSGVTGTAELVLVGDQLTVTITASGLEPNRTHPQHIHGFMENNGNATCPPPSADENGNGLVEIGEGAPFYGPVLLSLQPFPTADENGDIYYQETFTIDDSLKPLQNRTIVLHGMNVDGTYWATLPVACGQISVKNKGNDRSN